MRVPGKCSRSYFEYFAHTPPFLGASVTCQAAVIFSNTHVITQMVSVSMWSILSTPWPLSSLTSFFNDLFLQPTSLPGSKPSPHPYQQTQPSRNPNSEHFRSPNAPSSLSKILCQQSIDRTTLSLTIIPLISSLVPLP